MTDLNKEMGIEVNIPDPLKRQVPQRKYGMSAKMGQRRHARQRGDARDDKDRFGRRKRRSDDRQHGGKHYYGLRSRW